MNSQKQTQKNYKYIVIHILCDLHLLQNSIFLIVSCYPKNYFDNNKNNEDF